MFYLEIIRQIYDFISVLNVYNRNHTLRFLILNINILSRFNNYLKTSLSHFSEKNTFKIREAKSTRKHSTKSYLRFNVICISEIAILFPVDRTRLHFCNEFLFTISRATRKKERKNMRETKNMAVRRKRGKSRCAIIDSARSRSAERNISTWYLLKKLCDFYDTLLVLPSLHKADYGIKENVRYFP